MTIYRYLRTAGLGRERFLDIQSKAEEALGAFVYEVTPLNRRREISYRLTTSEGVLKLFFCESHSSAPIVHMLLNTLSHAGFCPAPLAFSDNFVIVPWVDGISLKTIGKHDARWRLLSMLEIIHSHPIPRLITHHDNKAPYLARLVNRTLCVRNPLMQERLERVRLLLAAPPVVGEQPGLLHTDLTVQNVVLTTTDTSLAIDNEAVTVGLGRAFDVWHAAESIYSLKNTKEMYEFVREYERRVPGSSVLSSSEYWLGVCWVKKALKAYASYRFVKASRALDRGLHLLTR